MRFCVHRPDHPPSRRGHGGPDRAPGRPAGRRALREAVPGFRRAPDTDLSGEIVVQRSVALFATLGREGRPPAAGRRRARPLPPLGRERMPGRPRPTRDRCTRGAPPRALPARAADAPAPRAPVGVSLCASWRALRHATVSSRTSKLTPLRSSPLGPGPCLVGLLAGHARVGFRRGALYVTQGLVHRASGTGLVMVAVDVLRHVASSECGQRPRRSSAASDGSRGLDDEFIAHCRDRRPGPARRPSARGRGGPARGRSTAGERVADQVCGVEAGSSMSCATLSPLAASETGAPGGNGGPSQWPSGETSRTSWRLERRAGPAPRRHVPVGDDEELAGAGVMRGGAQLGHASTPRRRPAAGLTSPS